MAIAPSPRRDLDFLVLSDLRFGSPYAHAEELLARLRSVRPRIIVLLGSPLHASVHHLDALTSAERRVLQEIELQARTGVRVYCLARSWEGESLGRQDRLVGQSGIQFRDELLLSVDGGSTLFVSPRLLLKQRMWLGCIDGVELLSMSAASALRRRSAAAIAKTLARVADDRGANRVVVPLIAGIPQVTLPDVSVTWSGSWARHRTLLESRFGRWEGICDAEVQLKNEYILDWGRGNSSQLGTLPLG